MTEKEKIKKALEELKQVCYLGDEGDAGIICRTSITALRKFKKKFREDVGPEEYITDMDEGDITTGWLHVCTDEELQEKDYEWYVSYEKQSPYEVWVYRA